MKRQTISDLEYSTRKRKARREKFLEIMDEIIPWEEWMSNVAPHYPGGKRGWPMMGVEKTRRLYLPLKFRWILEKNDRNSAFFDEIHRFMVKSGDIMKGGTISDARRTVR